MRSVRASASFIQLHSHFLLLSFLLTSRFLAERFVTRYVSIFQVPRPFLCQLTCTRDSGRLILSATSSRMNISGQRVLANNASKTSSCARVKVVLSRRCFLGVAADESQRFYFFAQKGVDAEAPESTEKKQLVFAAFVAIICVTCLSNCNHTNSKVCKLNEK